MKHLLLKIEHNKKIKLAQKKNVIKFSYHKNQAFQEKNFLKLNLDIKKTQS